MERYDDGFAEERQRIERLVEEIIAGEHKIDKLPNSSAGFSGAAQAEYFSKARYHLESDVVLRGSAQRSCLHTRFPGSFGENQFSFGIIPKKREIFLSMNVLLHICSSMNV